MFATESNIVYRAGIYLRISKEDCDPAVSVQARESNSISNQRLLILDYLKAHPEIEAVKEYCDDGYSGANFERPDFQNMIEAVRKGEINCIIVKDLSRFGREYIDSGNYMQKVFPALGVRFIAINDNYDSADTGAVGNELILPFKNLMNDAYCRDISIKVRTNLDAKRRSGQFVGSRVVYGYLRDPADKNRLVIDPVAAQTVQDIYRYKIAGMSPQQIADKLNESGVLSPIEYKKANGSRQTTAFQTKQQALWSAVAIYRILSNEMYTGTLVQGKTTRPNHKIKKAVSKDKSQWARIENAHEPIIASKQFELVQEIMRTDTRAPKGMTSVHPFSGKLFCADCGAPMTRKVSVSAGREYAYFVCANNKSDKHACSSHCTKEELVYEAVLAVLKAHISAAMDLEAAMRIVDGNAWEARELHKIDGKIAFQEEVIAKNRRLKASAYEDFHSQMLSAEEYDSFKAEFDKNIVKAREVIAELNRQKNIISSGLDGQQGWLAEFSQYKTIQAITRNVVVSLIDKVHVRANKDIDVQLRYKDQFAAIAAFLKERDMAGRTDKERAAM